MESEAQVLEEGVANGNGLMNVNNGINFDKNLVNICVNINVNEQIEEEDDLADPCQSCIQQTLTPEQISNINTVMAQDGVTFQVGADTP
jgi:hypothetical protein